MVFIIRLSLGNVGSGKTANEVREMFLNKTNRLNYSNIIVKHPNNITLKPEMIIKQDLIGTKKTGEPIYISKLNISFWKSINEPINIILDEAHSVLNARKSTSKINVIMTDWMSLIRRVLGNNDAGHGELVLISQLPRRLDVISREMATQIRYHVCHFIKSCKLCGYHWQENSEMSEHLFQCPNCNKFKILKHDHKIEIWHFKDMTSFTAWKDWGQDNTYYKHYIVNDIEEFFPYYDTLQWDNMFSSFY